MQLYRDLNAVDFNSSVVTVGTFDGVHLGHVFLLNQLVCKAKQKNFPSVVVTFWPHPRQVVSGSEVQLLSSLDEKIEHISAAGVDKLVVIEFTSDFSRFTPSEFIKQVLIDKLGAKYFLMGFNHHFGSVRLSLSEYEQICQHYGLEVSRCDQFVSDSNVSCSSSSIRAALQHGDIALANSMLGYAYSLSGTVVHGDSIGRTIGFPTANIVLSCQSKVLPADGVYVVSVMLDATPRLAVVNIGARPTLNSVDHRIEIYILDYEGDLYETELSVKFHSKIRDTFRFADLDDLKCQISKDVQFARKYWQSVKNA